MVHEGAQKPSLVASLWEGEDGGDAKMPPQKYGASLLSSEKELLTGIILETYAGR